VIQNNSKRHDKKLWSERGEGEPIQLSVLEEDRAEATYVAEEILKFAQTSVEGRTQQVRPWKDFAILYRSNPQSRLFEEALRMRKIPYKLVGALSFLDRKEVKDFYSYLRLILNPKDDASARRIINWPARGIGRTALEALNEIATREGISILEAYNKADLALPKAAKGLHAFRNLIQSLRHDLDQTPADPSAMASFAKRAIEKIGIKEALLAEAEDGN
jgi:superfamily I DNA/RNA helicase